MRNKQVKFVRKGQEIFGKVITLLADFPDYYAVFLIRAHEEEIPVLSYDIEFLD
jgi:hemolysin-activating ACP:hemolysin acyltransferase